VCVTRHTHRTTPHNTTYSMHMHAYYYIYRTYISLPYFQLVMESTIAMNQLEKVVIVVDSFIAYILLCTFNDIFQFSKDATGHGILFAPRVFINYVKWSFLQ